jgi:hypothetical protein
LGQDVEQIGGIFKKLKTAKPIKVSGGLNIGSNFYNIVGIPARRDPFMSSVNANLSIKLFETIDVGASINYNTNTGFGYDYTNPEDYIKGLLSRTGFSPKYKFVTLHLGDVRAMTFSPYTYAGVPFYGVGLEIKPNNSLVQFSTFKGTLQRRIAADTINNTPVAPAFERKGWGGKIDIAKKGHKLSLISFYAKDDVNSIPNLPSNFDLKPQENLVFGIEGKTKIGQKVEAMIEYATSAYTSDLRSLRRTVDTEFSYFNNFGKAFTPLLSTRYNNSIVGGITYKGTIFSIGGQYRYVDPTFVSLGSFQAKNDFEAYTVNTSLALFKGKVTMTLNGGTERNNLDNNLALSMIRVIGSASLNYQITNAWMVGGTYSNFNHSTSPSIINVNDSLRLVQVNENSNVMTSYSFGPEGFKQSIMLNGTFQKSQDIKEFTIPFNKEVVVNTVNNYMATHSLTLKSFNANFATTVMYTETRSGGFLQTNFGPSIAFNKKMLSNKIQLSLSTAYLANSGTSPGQTTNYRAGVKYTLNRYHAFKLDGSVIDKVDVQDASKSFTETQVRITYGFTL